jgi:hypothetical protein
MIQYPLYSWPVWTSAKNLATPGFSYISFCPFYQLCTFISSVLMSLIPLKHNTQTSTSQAGFCYSLVLCTSSELGSLSRLSCILHLFTPSWRFVRPGWWFPQERLFCTQTTLAAVKCCCLLLVRVNRNMRCAVSQSLIIHSVVTLHRPVQR